MTTEDKKAVMNIVAVETGVSFEDMTMRCRKQGPVDARRICMAILKEVYYLNPKEIGALFYQDRTTVIHAIQTLRGILDVYDEDAANYARIKTAVIRTMNVDLYKEMIVCPECNSKQEAIVYNTIPWPTRVYSCGSCQYVIMESEWTTAKPKEVASDQ